MLTFSLSNFELFILRSWNEKLNLLTDLTPDIMICQHKTAENTIGLVVDYSGQGSHQARQVIRAVLEIFFPPAGFSIRVVDRDSESTSVGDDYVRFVSTQESPLGDPEFMQRI